MIQHSIRYRMIAKRLIRTLPEFEDIRDTDMRIAYLSSDKEKKKRDRIVYGDCTKVDSRYSWCCPYDFFITIYAPNVEEFDDRQMEALIRHELHHVGIDYSGAEVKFYTVPHDIEEFWDIIDAYGLDWSDTRGKEENES